MSSDAPMGDAFHGPFTANMCHLGGPVQPHVYGPNVLHEASMSRDGWEIRLRTVPISTYVEDEPYSVDFVLQLITIISPGPEWREAHLVYQFRTDAAGDGAPRRGPVLADPVRAHGRQGVTLLNLCWLDDGELPEAQDLVGTEGHNGNVHYGQTLRGLLTPEQWREVGWRSARQAFEYVKKVNQEDVSLRDLQKWSSAGFTKLILGCLLTGISFETYSLVQNHVRDLDLSGHYDVRSEDYLNEAVIAECLGIPIPLLLAARAADMRMSEIVEAHHKGEFTAASVQTLTALRGGSFGLRYATV